MRRDPTGLRTFGIVAAAGALLILGKQWLEQAPAKQLPVPASMPAAGEPIPPIDPGPPEEPGEISVRSLIGELVDLERLAHLADPPFRTYLASSYDRRSKSTDDLEGWFANDDWASATRPNYVRIENTRGRREYVLMEAKGPGALVRLWTATPTGTLRIYLDGNATPVLAERLVDLLSGKGVILPPFAYVSARGYNAYFPVPYRVSCKVTVDDIVATDPFEGGPLDRFYYQIHYRTYPESVGPRVRTFRRSDIQRMADEINRVAQVLSDTARAYVPSSRRKLQRLERVRSEARLNIADKNSGIIREFLLRVPLADEAALRRATLQWTFDSEVTVEVPLGDFFGTGPGLNPYRALPFNVGSEGTLVSRWPMPFQKRATLVIRDAPNIEGEVSIEPQPWSDKSLYFHAQRQPEARVRTHPPRDLTLLNFEGSGAYVGTVFNLANTAQTRWWGEGDEKVYVDGEAFPSQFGTGTEDYFGYAWSTPNRFVKPLHAQTRADGPAFDGHFSMNRFHTLDRISFTTSLRFDLELWHWDDTEVTWDSVAYFYARPAPVEQSTKH